MFIVMHYKLRWGVLSNPMFYGVFPSEYAAETFAKATFTEVGEQWTINPINIVKDTR